MNENPVVRKADNLAIASLAFVWFPLVAVILGHMSLSSYKKTGTSYFKPIAVTGTVLGWLGIAGGVLYIISVLLIVAVAGTAGVTEALSSY